MFTVSIVRSNGDREGSSCVRYRIVRSNDAAQVFSCLPDALDETRHDIGPGDAAFVMNEHGKTVDVVRVRKAQTTAASAAQPQGQFRAVR